MPQSQLEFIETRVENQEGDAKAHSLKIICEVRNKSEHWISGPCVSFDFLDDNGQPLEVISMPTLTAKDLNQERVDAACSQRRIVPPGESVPFFGTVSPAEYNSLVTNHGTIMIFWVAMPVLIAAFGNLLIPLMIGADDMVFPRVNRRWNW